MTIVLSGRTRADYGNPQRSQTLAGATLLFYALPGDQAPLKPRWSFYPQPEGRIDVQLLGSAVVQADGTFVARLADHQGAVLVALSVEAFSYAPPTGKKASGVLGAARLEPVLLETVEKESRLGAARLDIHLSKAAYCAILELLDLWLVAGQVVVSGTTTPVLGVDVTAFDRDVTQDDRLGEARTDATGSFEIFFPGAQFRQLPPLLAPFDVIGALELVGGPDLYFQVRAGALSLLDEAPAAGRAPGRENVDCCSFTVLAVPKPEVPTGTGPDTGPTAWRAVGNCALIPATAGGATDFDAHGLTNVNKMAFFSSIKLRGAVFRKFTNGEPIRYRFLLREWPDATLTTGGPALPPAPPAGSTSTDPAAPTGWTPLTTHIDSGSPYGNILSWSIVGGVLMPLSLPLVPSPTANGWIEVDQRLLDPDQMFVPTDVLAVVKTDAIVPPAPYPTSRARKFSFVMQVQTASAVYQQGPYPLHINNDQVHLDYHLAALGSGCNPFTRSAAGTIDISASYTVAHPYLERYGTYVQRHDGASHEPMVGETFSPASPFWTAPAGISGTATKPGYAVEPCSYESGITARARLTSGEGQIDGTHERESFCVR